MGARIKKAKAKEREQEKAEMVRKAKARTKEREEETPARVKKTKPKERKEEKPARIKKAKTKEMEQEKKKEETKTKGDQRKVWMSQLITSFGVLIFRWSKFWRNVLRKKSKIEKDDI